MSRLRKILGLEQAGYDRPNQPWVCGHACEGHGCQLGPDKKGRCQAGGECLPRRSGDRWLCTRTADAGGPCADGPLPDGSCACTIPPCQPVRTLRSRRGLFTALAVLVTIGGLLFTLGDRAPDRWISPGPLTFAHATSEASCADCHTISPDEPASGMARLIANHPVASANCLECHELGPQPLLPHGLPARELATASSSLLHADGGDAGLLVRLAQAARAPIAGQGVECTSCHTEHHGRMADIRTIDDNQCQVCHQDTFKSFNDGHPDFGAYPYGRRTRIIFDHASHLQKHFKDPASQASAPASCLDCHVPGDTQGKMLVRSFEQSCASCHEPQIKGEGRAGAKGIAFFRVPGLDVETLEEAGHAIGQWPEFAEGPVNPFIKLLLSTDPEAVADLKAIETLDTLDLGSATPPQKAAASRTAWRIKTLFFDLTTQGQTVLMNRLGVISGDGAVSPALLAQLPGDALLAAKNAWWPDLFTEVPNYRNGILPPLPEPAKPAPAATPKPAAGGDDLILGDDDILGGDDLPASSPAPAKKTASDDILGDDILGDDILGDDLADTPPAKPASPASDSLDDILGDLGDELAAPAAPKTPPPPPVVTPVDPEAWVAMGGWYRSDDTYTLYYRPVGHADAFMKAWIDALGRPSSDGMPFKPRELIDNKAPGLCAKCHSVDQTPNGLDRMNWHAAQFNPRNHEATKFSHTAHFSLLNERGCQTCHVIDPQADYLSSYDEANAAKGIHHSNFQALSKETCASCHQNKIAGNSCQLCHNYHQGLFDTGKLPVSPARVEERTATVLPLGNR